MPRRILLASLFSLCVAVPLPAAQLTGQPKIQPKKVNPKPGSPWPDFPHLGSPHGSSWHGGPSGSHFNLPHSVASALGHGFSAGPFGGGGGLGGLGSGLPGGAPLGPLGGRGPVEEVEAWLLFGPAQGFVPGLGAWRDPFLDLTDPDREVRELLTHLRLNGHGLAAPNPLLPGRAHGGLPREVQQALGVMGFGGPSAMDPFGGLVPGLTGRRTTGFGRPFVAPGMFDDLWGTGPLGAMQLLNRPRLSYGLGGYRGQLAWLYDDPVFGLGGWDHWAMPGGIGGVGGFGNPFGNQLRRRNPWGAIDPWGPFFEPIPRLRVERPAPPPQPTREEKRDRLAKFEKSLVAVEASARAGAWGMLASGLEKATSASLPAGVVAPLRAVREESGRLTDLQNLRAAVTARWEGAPDAAAIEKHLAAIRAATGDRELADRLRRLLAVKAVWEGHEATAAALTATGEAPDLDAELTELQRPLLLDPTKASPVSTDDERLLACRRVVRHALEGIDHHLDCGRFNVAVHLVDVRALRTEAGKAVRELSGAADPKPPAGSFDTVAAEVGKKLGRALTQTDRVVLRQMHAADKIVAEMVQALR